MRKYGLFRYLERSDLKRNGAIIFDKGVNLCDFLIVVPAHQTPSEMGSALKGKNLLPIVSKFLPFGVDPFSEGEKLILKDFPASILHKSTAGR